MKPRRKQHQSHNNKGGHETSTRVKDTFTPNLQENEIVGAPSEGTFYFLRLQNKNRIFWQTKRQTSLLSFAHLFITFVLNRLKILPRLNSTLSLCCTEKDDR